MARSVRYPARRSSKRGRSSKRSARARAAHLGPERRRPLVLDAAFKLFFERGYEGTSMEAIARAAGVTKPVVYACFPSKEELFRALLEREEGRVLGQIQVALPDQADEDPEATLVDGLTAFFRAVQASPESYRLIFLNEGGGNRAVAERIRRGRELQIEAVAALAGRWLEGRKTSVDRDATARLIGQLVVGLAEAGARTLLSEPGTWTPDSLGKTLGRMAAQAPAAL